MSNRKPWSEWDNDWAVTQGLVDSMQQEEEHILLIVEQRIRPIQESKNLHFLLQQVELMQRAWYDWDAFKIE